MSELCLTPAKVAAHFGVGEGRVYSALNKGLIPHFRVGNLFRVRLSQVPEDLIDAWSQERKAFERDDLPCGQLVYFLGVSGYVKIGVTAHLPRRAAELQPGSPFRFELLAYVPGASYAEERVYHQRFRRHRVESEWFKLCPEIEAEIDRLNALSMQIGGAA